MLLLIVLSCAAPAASEPAPEPAPPARTVREAFPLPPGAERVDGGRFGAWLAELPVHPAERPVRAYDGRTIGHYARVVDLPLVPGDLQQCADSAIRLRAEWSRQTGAEISFHATSGDPMPWSRWQAGERPYEKDGRIAWRSGDRGGWEEYLAAVFTWAGTRSLSYDTAPASEPRPGDLVVVPGSPGHAIVLLDVARRGEQTLVLVGEGFMPAQDFHVEIGPVGGWWRWEDGVDLPHWRMPASGLRRWKP